MICTRTFCGLAAFAVTLDALGRSSPQLPHPVAQEEEAPRPSPLARNERARAQPRRPT
ncbi:MAG TPA: hypothetical protein VEY11_14405 [Pyrinomonadaceae bacterium]|nr:hypothetical protein [Pyrinomonadaceae bacterium]